MGTVVSNGYVTVEKAKYGMEATTYKNELDAVLSMIDNGTLGGGTGYGCEEHVASLAAVAAKVQEVGERIEAAAETERALDVLRKRSNNDSTPK